MKNKLFKIMVIILTCGISYSASANLVLDATRYIYNSEDNSISIKVSNDSDKKLYGGQVWVESTDIADSRPILVASPSFFKVEPGRKQIVRIINVADHLPDDRESLFWMSLQEIPPQIKGTGISMAIRTKVKVLYRPEGIAKGRLNAESKMIIERQGGRLYLKNSTPYIFAIGGLIDQSGDYIDLDTKQIRILSVFSPEDKIEVTDFNIVGGMALDDYGNTYEFKLSFDGDY
ncbi:fimbria/pilus periplasmic chaperone [Shewanella waksmanii]|uniref:fimbria/pilus periplasmic chaperone n=1 Tax=Shewanella waksmanii TaxID=213783 RepID=UPI000685B48D|nr:fimbria/pilus periplasmic chaperone [Shewanella waksmanii]